MWRFCVALFVLSQCNGYSYSYTQAKAITPPPAASPPVASPPVASPPAASPPVASPPVASPPVASPPVASPPAASPPVASPPLPAAQAPSVIDYESLIQNVFGLPDGSLQAHEEPTLDYFRPLSDPYDEFDWRLTKQVASTSEDNLLLSPLGLKLALAILTEAATGVTAHELQHTLGFDVNATKVRAKFENTLGSLFTKSNQYILDLGSRIYVGNRAEPRQKFAATAEQHYKTEVKKVDFDHPADAARDINTWIANITHGKIPHLVTEDDVDKSVMMILNTLYFKGTWRHQFDPNDTRSENFYATPEKVNKVPFMTMENIFYCVESLKLDAKIVRLPYQGNKFSMYIIVPNSINGLNRSLAGLTSNQLRQEILFLVPRKLRLMLPRYQFEYSSQLDGVLRELGIRHAFAPTASFPGISRGEGTDKIRISKVLQKSGIEVNEVGSIAYTSTAVSLVNRFGDEEDGVLEVKANKPFLFYIEDETTRQLLFTGRITDPAASAGRTL